jgi:histone deacetylase 1/2
MKNFQTGMPIMRCESQGDLYPIIVPHSTNKVTHPSTFATLSSSIWHNRLGHPGNHILSFLKKNKLIECNNSSQLHSNFCNSCPLGKHIKLSFKTSSNKSLLPFDILHSDVWTSPVLSSLDHKYYVLFLDDYSNFWWTFPMSNKSQVYSIFEKLRTYIKTQFQREIKTLQCDNGGEYVSRNFQNMCEQNGIHIRLSCPYTSPQNGKAERKIRSVNNIIRTLLHHASLPPSLWPFALEMATYLSNISPSKTIQFQSPLYMLYNKHPSYSHLRVFGCLCFPLFPSNTIHKLQPRSTPCVFLGYPSNHRGYKCLNMTTHKIIICHHVLFDESTFPYAKLHTPQSMSYNFLDGELSPYLINHIIHHDQANNPQSPPADTHPPVISSPPHSPSTLAHPNAMLNEPSTTVRPNQTPSSISSQSNNTCANQLQPQAQPTSHADTKPVTRSQHGIFKPNPKYCGLHIHPSKSPLPRNPVSALKDPN